MNRQASNWNWSGNWSKGLALATGGLLLIVCFARASKATTTSITTVYSGSECRPGSYFLQSETVSKNGHLNSNTAFDRLSPLCHIPRTNPSLPFVMVEAYFMDTTTGNEENPTASVSCRVQLAMQNAGAATQDGRWVTTPSRTMTGVYHQSSLLVSYAGLEQPSQPFWTSITAATTPQWQRADFLCDSLPDNIAIRSYVVTESN